jgi:glycosyltransferase involved in cell wall biosynthesis
VPIPEALKILHIISQRPESTGSGVYLQNIIRQAAHAGHQNYLIAGVSKGNLPDLDCIEKERFGFIGFEGADLNFAIPGMSDVMPYPSSIFGSLSTDDLDAYEKVFAEKISSAAGKFSPDIIHSHHLWIATAVARRVLPEIPMVTSCHSTDLRQFINCRPLRQRVLTGCQKIERVLALSRDQNERIRKLYGIPESRIDIVGGGYDQNLFIWSRKAAPPPVHLLYAGKLSFAKGVDWLLRTCRRLSDLPLHLHLAGSGAGDEAKDCLELAAHSGVEVTVHGRITQEELASLMRFCHIFILPSFFEGLPLVLLEALASGCRIITTDLPGCRELLGKASKDLVLFINLPKMQEIDRPFPEDRDRLEEELAVGVKRMVGRVLEAPTPAHDEVEPITSNSGWQAVFQRIMISYEKAVNHST